MQSGMDSPSSALPPGNSHQSASGPVARRSMSTLRSRTMTATPTRMGLRGDDVCGSADIGRIVRTPPRADLRGLAAAAALRYKTNPQPRETRMVGGMGLEQFRL